MFLLGNALYSLCEFVQNCFKCDAILLVVQLWKFAICIIAHGCIY
jgi:hypothetical protein